MRRGRPSTKGLAIAGLLVLGGSANADPRIDYMLHCQGCHLPDLQGSPGIVPGLRTSVGRLAAAPGGRDYLMRVPGAAQARLSDERLAGVLNWIMETYNADSKPEGFAAFTAEEVGEARKHPLLNPQQRRREILEDNGG